MQRISLGFLLLALLVAGSCPGRADGGLACDLPADLILPADPLAHVAAALAKKNQLDILALGSGSTVGDSERRGRWSGDGLQSATGFLPLPDGGNSQGDASLGPH